MRPWTKHVVEDYRALDARRLARTGALKDGSSVVLCWPRSGEDTFSIRIKAQAHAIRLTYDASGRRKDYYVSLDRTPCNFGGTRVWLRCPVVGCRRRVAKLYGGDIFICRHCRQLNYACQQWSKRDYASNQSWRLRQRLGYDLGFLDLPSEYLHKPKHMHWKRFNRLIARLQRYDTEAEVTYVAVMAGFMEKLARHSHQD